MPKLRSALLVFLFIALPASARADDALVRDFKSSARSIPQNLQRLGYDSFGRLNLAQFLRQMEAPEVKATGFFHRAEPGTPLAEAARSTAQWKRQPGGRFEILVNAAMWKQVPRSAKTVIALHEYLGVAGYNDRNYELSTALWMLSLPEADRAFDRPEKIQIAANVGEVARSGNGGGITGVGGGGDFGGITTRMTLLKRGVHRLAGTTGEERNQRLREINSAFRLRAEVRWSSTKTKNFSYESIPGEIAEATQTLTICQQFLKMKSTVQLGVFETLSRQRPELIEKIGNLQRFKANCQKAVAGSGLD